MRVFRLVVLVIACMVVVGCATFGIGNVWSVNSCEKDFSNDSRRVCSVVFITRHDFIDNESVVSVVWPIYLLDRSDPFENFGVHIVDQLSSWFLDSGWRRIDHLPVGSERGLLYTVHFIEEIGGFLAVEIEKVQLPENISNTLFFEEDNTPAEITHQILKELASMGAFYAVTVK